MPATAPAPAPRTVPAAMSPLTAALVQGPPSEMVVAGAHRFGVYLVSGRTVLPVLARDAAAMPTAVRCAVEARRSAWAARAGDVVVVGAGSVVLPLLEVRAVRSWRPSRVRPATRHGAPDPAVRRLLDPGPGDPPPDHHWLHEPLLAALAATEPGHAAVAVAAVVGRGPGLTPAGDDALAGALLVRAALAPAGPARPDPLSVAVRGHLARTTAVSAALLEAAADGWSVPEVVALVDAVAASDGPATAAALPAVLALGHTSGRDLVAGIRAALGAPGSAGSAPRRRRAA